MKRFLLSKVFLVVLLLSNSILLYSEKVINTSLLCRSEVLGIEGDLKSEVDLKRAGVLESEGDLKGEGVLKSEGDLKSEVVLKRGVVLKSEGDLKSDGVKKGEVGSSLPLGLSYVVGSDIMSNYIWRGLYVGGIGIQSDIQLSYYGIFLDMWWNVGANNWTFNVKDNNPGNSANTKLNYGANFNPEQPFVTPSNQSVAGFNPEVDITIGFSRWGLTVMFMHMYYFDYYRRFDGSIGGRSRYFDFSNAAPGGGITQEWRVKYRVSDALPLSILLCTRTWGRDGYMVDGEGRQIGCQDYAMMEADEQARVRVKRAYSSYLELGYDFRLPHDLTLEARLGMTPWKSMYTGYMGEFAVCNVSAKLNWARDLGKRGRLTVFANLMLNPYDMATGLKINGSGNPVLWNVGCGFWLK